MVTGIQIATDVSATQFPTGKRTYVKWGYEHRLGFVGGKYTFPSHTSLLHILFSPRSPCCLSLRTHLAFPSLLLLLTPPNPVLFSLFTSSLSSRPPPFPLFSPSIPPFSHHNFPLPTPFLLSSTNQIPRLQNFLSVFSIVVFTPLFIFPDFKD